MTTKGCESMEGSAGQQRWAQVPRTGASVFELLQDSSGLAAALDSFAEFISLKDTRNRHLYVNQAVAESLGVPAEEIIGKPCEVWYPENAAEYYVDDLEVIESGEPKLGIIEPIPGPLEDPSQMFVTDKYPLRNRGGEVAGLLVVSRRIGEQDTLRHRLTRATRLEALGQIVGGFSHELNNLFTVMLANIELAHSELSEKPDVGETLDAAAEALDLAVTLNRRLADVCSHRTPVFERVDLNALLDRCERLLRGAVPRNVRLTVHPSVSNPQVRADSIELSQVLVNLVANARDALPDGGNIRVGIDTRTTAQGGWAVITVGDTGAGIPADIAPHIFDRNYTTKRSSGGSGLGLAISKEIIDRFDGDIRVGSTPEGGAELRVFLPLAGSKRDPQDPR